MRLRKRDPGIEAIIVRKGGIEVEYGYTEDE